MSRLVKVKLKRKDGIIQTYNVDKSRLLPSKRGSKLNVYELARPITASKVRGMYVSIPRSKEAPKTKAQKQKSISDTERIKRIQAIIQSPTALDNRRARVEQKESKFKKKKFKTKKVEKEATITRVPERKGKERVSKFFKKVVVDSPIAGEKGILMLKASFNKNGDVRTATGFSNLHVFSTFQIRDAARMEAVRSAYDRAGYQRNIENYQDIEIPEGWIQYIKNEEYVYWLPI